MVYFCDFETITKESKEYYINKHTYVFLWYLKDVDNNYKKYGNTLDEFFKEILTFKGTNIIYFHNLSFDGNFIIKWLMRNFKDGFLNINENSKSKVTYRLFKNNNKYYYIKVYYCDTIISFQCTFNLLSTSIENLGKSYNLTKTKEIDELIKEGIIKSKEEFYNFGGLNMPFKIKNYFLQYIKRDVEIARLAYINLKENLNDLNKKYSSEQNWINLEDYLTIGSVVYKLSQNYLIKKYGSKFISKYFLKYNDYQKCKPFYYGGWTQFNPIYWNKKLLLENGVIIDINSSYPYQMTKNLPYGKLTTYRKLGEKYLTYYKVRINDIQIKDEYKNLICFKNWKKENDDRYLKKGRYQEAFYYEKEWELIKKIYDLKIDSIEKYYCKCDNYLEEFINELYNLKEYYSSIGDNANKVTYKIMLNALYGKQCARAIYPIEKYIDENEIQKYKLKRENDVCVKEDGKLYLIGSISIKKVPVINKHIVKLIPLETNGWYPNIMIGAQITSYARIQLWETILKVGVNKYMYSDTDSIFFNLSKNEKIEDYVDIHKTHLGKWSVDCLIEKGKILGAKKYVFFKKDDDKIKLGFSGLNNLDINEINWDNVVRDDNLLEKSQIYREEDEYGILLGLKDIVIKKGKN